MQYRIVSLLSMFEIQHISFKEESRKTITCYPNNNKMKNNILIVEESLRGDYLDVNLNKNITPYLLSKKGRIINFGLASSGANCSAQSNQILRFGPNVNNFESTFKTNPLYMKLCKKAGYKTLMIEGQAKEGMLNNRIKKRLYKRYK